MKYALFAVLALAVGFSAIGHNMSQARHRHPVCTSCQQQAQDEDGNTGGGCPDGSCGGY